MTTSRISEPGRFWISFMCLVAGMAAGATSGWFTKAASGPEAATYAYVRGLCRNDLPDCNGTVEAVDESGTKLSYRLAQGIVLDSQAHGRQQTEPRTLPGSCTGYGDETGSCSVTLSQAR